jgi:hypothetical protein
LQLVLLLAHKGIHYQEVAIAHLLLVHCLQSLLSIFSLLEADIAKVLVVSLLVFGNSYWVNISKVNEEVFQLVFVVVLGNVFDKQVIELFLHVLSLVLLLVQRQL